jgi:peptide/nickel transport system ATP-binding protein
MSQSLPSDDSLLTVRHLTVDYGGRRGRGGQRAIEDVSLDIAPGETVGLVGESGSGKSTIARAILGLAPVTSGTVTFAGRDITRASFHVRRRLASDLQAVFQDPTSSLNPSRTVGSILAEPMVARGIRDRSRVRDRVRVMLDKVGLPPDSAARYPGQFSGGQRQRIGIARALMLSPRLVICDEVVSALDLSVQAQVLNLLQDLQEGQKLSYLFVSHDPDVVRHLCDRVVVLYRGRVMESGEAGRVTSAPAHPYTADLLAAAPVPDPGVQRARHWLAVPPAAAVAAQTPSGEQPAAGRSSDIGCPFRDRCQYAIETCRHQTPFLRPAQGQVSVACHRYPEWLGEKARAGKPETPATASPRAVTTQVPAREAT